MGDRRACRPDGTSDEMCSSCGAAAGNEHVESMASKSVEERLEALLREHGAWLRRTVEQTCPRDLAIQPEEVEQEVRLRLWRALGRESELRHPASYLRRVVTTAPSSETAFPTLR